MVVKVKVTRSKKASATGVKEEKRAEEAGVVEPSKTRTRARK